MFNWFKKNKNSEVCQILLSAFPKSFKKEVENVISILQIDENKIFSSFQIAILDGEILKIPTRIYFDEPTIENEQKLTNKEKEILNCIFLRHHNGYVRQRRLENIKSNEYWVTPFTFQLLGEYIIEIIQVIDEKLDTTLLDNYTKFARENIKYFDQTECRIFSYWNIYYNNNFPNFNLYCGKIVFDKIKLQTLNKCVDEIIEIGIDSKERLYVKPKNSIYAMIYRTATGIEWDVNQKYLFSPKPREWSYFDWYKHILEVLDIDCNMKLILTNKTILSNINDELKVKIIKYENKNRKLRKYNLK